jgi:manganese transport protein
MDTMAITTISTFVSRLRRSRARRGLPLSVMGPAFVAAIAYIDPGNVATNLTAGATTGYLLAWVVVAASVVAVFVQFQAAKLGIATGRSLPELCRERFPRWGNRLLWAQAEIVVIATDLAEFVGAAIGLKLVFGVPVAVSGVVTGVLAMLMLELRRHGHEQRFELASVAALVLVGTGLLYTLCTVGHQSSADMLRGMMPSFAGSGSVVLAMGIVGATVMPHVIYLHSAISQRAADAGRSRSTDGLDAGAVRRALRWDCGLAMGVATVVNVSMIALGAGLATASGGSWTGDLLAGHAELASRVGGGAALMFSIALLSSGLSSGGVCTLAGDVVMVGFLNRRFPVRMRRLITMAPAVAALLLGVSMTGLLVISQVVISLGVPVALFLLAYFCRDRAVMGVLVNARLTTRATAFAGGTVAAVGCALPLLLLA